MVRLHGWTLYTVSGCEMIDDAGAKWTNCPVVPQNICQQQMNGTINIDKRSGYLAVEVTEKSNGPGMYVIYMVT